MATSDPLAGDLHTEKDQWTRSSFQYEPPLMSGIKKLRIMLMGQTTEGQRSAGNLIFGSKVFPVSAAQNSFKHVGLVAGRPMSVTTTADVFNPNLSKDERSRRVGKCLGLSAPGPHLFLWVQQDSRIMQEDWDALRRFKESFGEGASKYSMVLFMHEDDDEYVSVGDSARSRDPAVHDFIQEFEGKFFFYNERNPSGITELLGKIQEIVEENESSYYKEEIVKQQDVALEGPENIKKEAASRVQLRDIRDSMKYRRPNFNYSSLNAKNDTRECVRMVLVGRTGVGKSAAGNTILGKEEFDSRTHMKSVTKKCQKLTGIVAGRMVAVIDTPGLFETALSTEDTQQEIMNCMGLASPGPHVFLLVIQVGRFTDVERETLRLIKMTFGDKAEKYTIVLFSRGDDLGKGQSIKQYIAEGDPEVKKMIQSCGGRYHVFNNKEKENRGQVLDLFKKIDRMNWDNESSCYTHKMFLEAERAMMHMQMKTQKEEELKRELEALQAKYNSEFDNINRCMVEERNVQEREWEKIIKFMQWKEEERAEMGEQHKRRHEQERELGEIRRKLRLLEMATGEEEGREGASKTQSPEQHGQESRRGWKEQSVKMGRGEKGKQVGDGSAGVKNVYVSLTRADYSRLLHELKKYQEVAQRQAEDLQFFRNKYSSHFEGVKIKKEKLCVIQ